MKFRDMSIEQRIKYLKSIIPDIEVPNLSIEIANNIIENVVAKAELPIGLVFGRINDEDRIIALALEEPSVVAAANKAFKSAKWVKAQADESIMIGTLYVKDSINKVIAKKDEIISRSKELTKSLEKYGGGFKDLKIDEITTIRGKFTRLMFLINVGDAMGANIINTFLESIELFELPVLRILSNYAIYRKAYVEACWEISDIDKFLDVISIAEADKFRKVTYLKGFMNGVSAAAIAYGQDWRAIEAGIHAYAYLEKNITSYWEKGGLLYGRAEIPLAVGTVGGATKVLPHAKFSMKLSKVKNSKDLAMLMASVGLMNNFGANYHLATEGIQKGHMKLHARNIALSVGATSEIIDKVVDEMIKANNFSYEFAKGLVWKYQH